MSVEISRRELLELMAVSGMAPLRGRVQLRSRNPALRPGRASIAFHAPDTRQVALTIDDGYDPDTVAAYVKFCENTGFHLTFNPVGELSSTWDRHARALRSLVARGQVQIGNHTYHHRILTTLKDSEVRDEIERNDSWIEKTFGTTARPYFRPPGGIHDERIDGICGELGYTRILLWQGSFHDSVPVTSEELWNSAESALHPGAVVLGHANQPTVIAMLGRLASLMDERRLESATLDELFGTTRKVG